MMYFSFGRRQISVENDTFQELFQRDWIQSRGISQWQSSDSDYILNEMARLFANKTLSNVKIQPQKTAHFLQEPIRSQHFVFGVRFSLRTSHIPNFGIARGKHSKKKGKRWISKQIFLLFVVIATKFLTSTEFLKQDSIESVVLSLSKLMKS